MVIISNKKIKILIALFIVFFGFTFSVIAGQRMTVAKTTIAFTVPDPILNVVIADENGDNHFLGNRVTVGKLSFVGFASGSKNDKVYEEEVVKLFNLNAGLDDSKCMWLVPRFSPVIIIKKLDNYYLVKDFEGDHFYVLKTHLNDKNSVATKETLIFLYSGPGMDYDLIAEIEGSGIPFLVLGKKNGWILVQHSDGTKGWLHSDEVW
ncbi:MAG: hypothetical protein GY707_12360 [Desulfobacteraceae bacterium]|nr:hypothetical protein [Desulfobacteraceae bacterium]